jgi:hypothetical protein
MSRNKHRQSGHTPIKLPADDLACNPGIGASRGATLSGAGDLGADDLEDGENTFEGDVENDVALQGGINPEQRSRGH